MQVNIFYKTPLPAVYRKSALFKRGAVSALGRNAGLLGEINVVFVSEREIHKINKEFLGHDYVTDVITFPFPFDKKIKTLQPYGDIFICYKTAKKNASLYGHTVLEEMLMYVLHGALHLTGMDDATPKERAAMDAKAIALIRKIL